MSESERQMTFWLAGPERRVLRWMAARVPRRLRPNHFTAVGVMGAVVTGLAFAMSGSTPAWLGVAALMLAVNWFGDSLDGTLARVRRHERPRYGYYLDHLTDGFNTAVVGVGLGLSPMLPFGVAMALLVLYLLLSINVYLESNVFGVFRMAYGRIGPTEGRVLLAAASVAWWALTATGSGVADHLTLAGAVVGTAMAVGMAGLLAHRFAANLRRLARLEPQPQ